MPRDGPSAMLGITWSTVNIKRSLWRKKRSIVLLKDWEIGSLGRQAIAFFVQSKKGPRGLFHGPSKDRPPFFFESFDTSKTLALWLVSVLSVLFSPPFIPGSRCEVTYNDTTGMSNWALFAGVLSLGMWGSQVVPLFTTWSSRSEVANGHGPVRIH